MEVISGKRILVVDDEELIRYLLKDSLEDLGAEVVIAEDGEEAVKIASSQTFHVLISDIKMPKMTGLELIAKLKESKIQIPTFLMTGFLDYRSFDLSQYQYEAIVFKPFDTDELFDSIRLVLQKPA